MRSDSFATLVQPHGCLRHRLTVMAMLLAVLVLLLAPGQGLATGGGTVARVFEDGFELQREERMPAPDSVLPADALPRVGLRLLEGSVEPSSWSISLNGKNVTAQSQVSATEVMYTPSSSLFEGSHVVEVRTGTRTVAWNFTTRTPPSIGEYGPLGEVPPDDLRPEIFAQYTDVGSGIDPARVRLLLDGVDITSSATVGAGEIRWRSSQDLPDGERFVSLEVLDRAGNQSAAAWNFTVGPQPILEIVAPQEELLPFGARPEISVTVTLTRGALDPESVVLFLNDVDLTQELQIAQPSPNRLEVQIQPPDGLPSGSYQIYAEARSQTGLGGFAIRQFSVDIERTYLLEFVPPAQGAVVLDPRVEIRVRANSTSGAPRVITLDGDSPLSRRLEDGNYVYRWVAELNPGANTLRARAEFPDGGSRTTELQLTHERAPTISISTPSDWSILGPAQRAASGAPGDSRDLTGGVQRAVTVAGTTSEPVVEVQVNQQQAQLGADGRSFTFPNFFLHEGTNLIGAVARDAHGRSATAQITVYVDQTAPLLTVESPEAEAVTSRQRIDVRGVVNDAVEGRLGAEQPEVEVRNGANEAVVSAQVTNLGYLALDVPLEVDTNTLTVTARDQHGNARSREVTVVRTAVGASRLLLLGGDRQSGLAETDLDDALEVQAIDSQGMPLQGHAVRFDVLRGSGSIRDGAEPVLSDGINPARNLEVLTDAEGIARVWLRLGRDARPGSDVVRAGSTALAEDVIFTASAMAGEAHRVGAFGTAGAQYVAIDSTPVEALMAQVLDAQDNPVADAAVEFAVITGEASFGVGSGAGGVVAPDGRAITVRSDRNGVAAVRPRSGTQPGTAQIRAEVVRDDGSRIGEAMFQLEVLARRDGPTALSGLVMDHDGTPLEGIRLSLSRTPLSVLSDAAGYFRFPAQVPPGKVDLFVDGRDVRFTRGGAQFEYPALHFETAIVQGQENQLPHPVYLPPVETSRAVVVGGANDVTLTLPGFEGFEMIVRANSVTFPDGSREGPLAVSAVHADRLPMVPPGMAGRFATVGWTIQPTGTRFDPPIEVHIPNTEDLTRGRTLPIVQWDHDLAAFVPMGNGTVSEDGTRIVSDSGSGITKAGWGGGGPPPPPPNTGCGSAPRCTECEEPSVNGNGCKICVPRELGTRGSANICLAPKCRFDRIESECIAEMNNPVTFEAILPPIASNDPPNAPEEIVWSGGTRAIPAAGQGVRYQTLFSSFVSLAPFSATVDAVCSSDASTRNFVAVDVARGCSSLEPVPLLAMFDATLVASTTDFGLASRQWYVGRFVECVASNQWQHRFAEASMKYDTDTNSNGRTVLNSPQDTAITDSNCLAVLNDLTPSVPQYGIRIAPYASFVPMPIILAHENFHHADYRQRVATPLTAWMDTYGRSYPTTQCKVANPYAQVVPLWRAERDRLDRAFVANQQHEVRAYALENGLLDQWRNDIRARARTENWRQACQ